MGGRTAESAIRFLKYFLPGKWILRRDLSLDELCLKSRWCNWALPPEYFPFEDSVQSDPVSDHRRYIYFHFLHYNPQGSFIFSTSRKNMEATWIKRFLKKLCPKNISMLQFFSEKRRKCPSFKKKKNHPRNCLTQNTNYLSVKGFKSIITYSRESNFKHLC